jgi:hypothetical protein
MPRRSLTVLLIAALAVLTAAAPSQALRKASHKGWPKINGMLLINKFDQSRPLDARPGADPFQHTDPSYRCDGDHQYQGCFIAAAACPRHPRHRNLCASAPVIPLTSHRHHELLGGHGNDRIYGGRMSDVIWGDYKPDQQSRQALTQVDYLYGGGGSDFIYGSHGYNVIHTGSGKHDKVFVRYGRGEIYCESKDTLVNLSRRSKKRFKLHGCHRVTLRAVGTEPA